MKPTERVAASERIPTVGLVLVAILVLLWGSNFPAMKVGLSEIPPFTFRAVSNGIAVVGLLGIGRLIMGHRLAVPRRDLAPLLLVATLNIAGWQLFLTFGLLRIDAAKAIIIAYTMPLWAALFGWLFLKEILSGPRLAGIAIGFGGVAVLNFHTFDAAAVSVTGVLLTLGAALCWAAGTVALKLHRWQMPTITLTGWQVAIGSIPMVIGMAILEDPSAMLQASTPALLGLLYTAIIAMVICHWVWNSLLRMIPAAAAATSTLAIPICGVYVSALVLGDQVGRREAAALALVVAGLFLVLLWPVVRARFAAFR